MNVLLFPRILAKTGVGNHVLCLAKELQNQGHKVVVISSTNELNVEEAGVEFIKITADTKNPIKLLRCIQTIHNTVKKYNIDVVHCHHRMSALIMKIYNAFYKKIRVVYTLHLANVPSDFIHRLFSVGGDYNIGVSSEASAFMAEKLKINSSKIITVLNGVPEITSRFENKEIAQLKQQWNIAENKKIFVMHSRIDKVKNHMLVVEAVNKLPQSVRDKFVVVCSGLKEGEYYNNIVAKIEEYNLGNNFRFVGWIDTCSIMSVADCMLAPSFNEGFLLTVVEAFLLKVLVARSETAGFYDQKYCLSIDQTNPQDIMDLITDICENGIDKYNKQILKAFDYAKEELTIQRMTEKTVDVYRKVCE